MGKLFGTSGVRGLVDRELTPELATKLGLAFATFLGNEGTVGVAGDNRLTTHILKNAVISGLCAGGVNVIDFGIVPTPALLHAVKEYKLKGAIMVTGSHTPPEINGLLFFLSDTAELTEDEEKVVEDIIFGEEIRRVPWNEVGKVETSDAISPYVNHIVARFGEGCFSSWKPRVVLDHGNGVSVLAAPKVLTLLGCDVININDVMDGRYPSRIPYPKPDTLTLLSRTVREVNATLGVGFDGDADRAIFVDELGTVHWGDVAGAIFAMEELKAKGSGAIVCPINTSRLIEYVVKELGGRVVYTRVGPPAIVKGIKTTKDVVFAFEETGKYIWPWNVLYGDSVLATAIMLKVVERYGNLSEVVAKLPKFYQFKEAVHCPNELKGKVLKRVKELIKQFNLVGEVIEIDGVKVVLEDGSWILFRPSGTEPVFRCYVEAQSRERAEELRNIGLKILMKAMSSP